MSQRVIRMTNESFENMIAESVLNTLNEGFWSELGNGLVKSGTKVGKYAWNRIAKGEGEHVWKDENYYDKLKQHERYMKHVQGSNQALHDEACKKAGFDTSGGEDKKPETKTPDDTNSAPENAAQ